MNIKCVNVSERFDNTYFSNEVVEGLSPSVYALYTCPHCGEAIRFQKRDFEGVVDRRHWTNLGSEAAKYFDDFASEYVGRAHAYLDWICPRCGLATRVYAQPWAGGRHGDYGIRLIAVLEGMPLPAG
jgi:hypothetical protein